ncbi:hypothetical protein HYPSUDRAFT_616184 [Hypholoma sublateritium FD-334 SS-4]|uniref:Uncharacterized protein n=1 Tax=Hypholoma sublateritium (strain FD-334 SS-4) TaxID=945553 RepID=A0A0D2MXD7_HYPSF|nr:hypothetical protein HYPSUDRAFT_616184 [Hypholoma sublateritium FD-334 SS-4]
MDSLDENNVYRVQPGRVLDDDDLVKDVIGVGLQHLAEGTKGPIHDFNKAFHGLQKRRQMKPVSTLAEEYLTGAPASTDLPPATSTVSIPAPAPDLPPLESTVDDEIQLINDDSDVEMGDVFEEPSELEGILNEVVHGENEPTLPRLTSEDVDLDMDEVEIEKEDSDNAGSEWEDDDDSGDE